MSRSRRRVKSKRKLTNKAWDRMLKQVEAARARGKITKGTRRFHPEGFTVVDLLVAVAIIAVLMAILAPSLSAARDRARDVACSAGLRGLAIAIRIRAEEQGALPDMYWRPQRDEWQNLEEGDRVWTCPASRPVEGASTYRYVPGELAWSMRGPTQEARMRQVLPCYRILEEHGDGYSGKLLYDWEPVHRGQRNVSRWSGWAGRLADPREVGTQP